MELKKCTKCKKLLPKKQFYNHAKGKDGLMSWCKKCDKKRGEATSKKRKLTYWHSRKNKPTIFLQTLHDKMKFRVTSGKYPTYYGKPICSKKEFINFATNDNKFNKLWKEWIALNYQKEKTPSIDRISNDGGYTLDNMQFLTFRENTLKR
jgi:hypothetical protein